MEELTKQKQGRHYKTTDLPTIDSDKNPIDKAQILKDIYGEVNTNYRHLADIRFKLLGLVPAVSVIAWVELIGKLSINSISSSVYGLVIAIIGLRITFGVRLYDKRNDDLYDDLISRGRKIEDELGVHTGIFKGRKKGQRKDRVFKKIINHGRGLALIYSSVFIGWGLIIAWYIYGILRIIWIDDFPL